MKQTNYHTAALRVLAFVPQSLSTSRSDVSRQRANVSESSLLVLFLKWSVLGGEFGFVNDPKTVRTKRKREKRQLPNIFEKILAVPTAPTNSLSLSLSLVSEPFISYFSRSRNKFGIIGKSGCLTNYVHQFLPSNETLRRRFPFPSFFCSGVERDDVIRPEKSLFQGTFFDTIEVLLIFSNVFNDGSKIIHWNY